MSLVQHGPALASLDESIALSIPSRDAKLLGSWIVPNLGRCPWHQKFYLAVQHKML
jgi:hypothetical protein